MSARRKTTKEVLLERIERVPNTPRYRGSLKNIVDFLSKGFHKSIHLDKHFIEIVKVLARHFQELHTLKDFNAISDMERLMYGRIPKHLEEWDSKWEKEIIPEIRNILSQMETN